LVTTRTWNPTCYTPCPHPGFLDFGRGSTRYAIRLRHVSNGQNPFSQPDQTPLTVTSTLPVEVVMQLFKRMGYVRHVFHLLRSWDDISHPPPPQKPTCYPREGLWHVGRSHDRQGRLALGTPRTTEQSDDRVEQPGCVGRGVGRAMDVARGRAKLCERVVQSRVQATKTMMMMMTPTKP
jgi:hypothetical protein